MSSRSIEEYLIEIADYPIIGRTLIGCGSFGEVYKAQGTKRCFAALRFPTGPDSEEVSVGKYGFGEIQFFMQVPPHPCIGKFLGFCLHPKIMIVTEYQPNGSLRELFDKLERGEVAQWTDTLRAKIILGVAAAMAHINAHGVVHRCLTPKKVMFDADWNPKVVNFGFSKTVTTKSTQTNIGLRKDLGYVAPECMRERPDYGGELDVYSYGMIVYAICREREVHNTPWWTDTDFSMQKRFLNGERPPLYCVPDLLKGLIEGCWGDDPANRLKFQSIVEQLMMCDEPLFRDVNMNAYNTYKTNVMRWLSPVEIDPRLSLSQENIDKFTAKKASADSGDVSAIADVVLMLREGRGIAKNPEEAFRYCLMGAEKGDLMCMYNVSVMYLGGSGTGKNEAEGARWAQKAADHVGDFGLAIKHYGYILKNGIGVGVDLERAATYLKKAADTPHCVTDAMFFYAEILEASDNIEEALVYFQKAVDGGNLDASCEIGRIKASRGNLKEGIIIYKSAAGQGSTRACHSLGCIYQKGLWGVKQDWKESDLWYKKAADLGDASSMVQLGMNIFNVVRGKRRAPYKSEHQPCLRYFAQATCMKGKENHEGRMEGYHMSGALRLKKEWIYDVRSAVEFLKSGACMGCYRSVFQLANLFHKGSDDVDALAKNPDAAKLLYELILRHEGRANGPSQAILNRARGGLASLG